MTDNNLNITNATQSIGLSGSGIAATPVAGVSPNTLAFGPQDEGTTSASQPVTLSNTGTGTLAIASIVPSAGFGETDDCNGSVAAGSFCTINVTFSPTGDGAIAGTLTITDNTNGVTGSQQSVSLSGTGNPAAGNSGLVYFAGAVTSLGGGFNFPWGVAVDKSGNVYVGDSSNNAVEEMPAGCASQSCVTTLGGGLSEPAGVAVDGSGNVYVADYDNNAVKEMPAGCASQNCVTTLGGGFYFPISVAVDGSGNIYVADYNNNAVKMMTPGCASITCVTTLGVGLPYPMVSRWMPAATYMSAIWGVRR